jgi:LuxR family transcriptional regulator, positive regulator of biofilm formation
MSQYKEVTMNLTTNDDINNMQNFTDVLIHVIGPNILQNELLTSFLSESLGLQCKQHKLMDSSFRTALKSGLTHLLLMDCLGDKKIDPWRLYNFKGSELNSRCLLTFYNVHTEAGIENKAIEQGVHGLFYQKDSFKVLPKAIPPILRGELWFSRKTLSNCLLNGHGHVTSNRVSTDMASCLTERERQILIRIASGIGNQQIADELCISLHTVKTHIYNIYKKINVKNRLQASLWAARYV